MTTIERLAELCESEGLSKSSVAKELGMSNSTFSDWESGKAKPSLEKLIKFAKRFDVSLDWLVFGEERRSPNEILFQDSQERQLLLKFRQLPASNKITAVAYIDGLLDAAAVPSEEEASYESIS